MNFIGSKIVNKINNTGWFTGELKVNLTINRSFEGYYGKASEDWETQYEINTEGIVDSYGKVQFPPLHFKSTINETLIDFIKRVENSING